MKFTAVLSYVLVALVAGAVAEPQFGGRQGNGKGGFGGFGGGNNNNAKGAGNANTGNTNNNNNNNAGNTAASATNNNNNGASSTDTAAGAATASASTATGGNSNVNSANAQDSTTLDPSVIATGFAQNGQQSQEAGQVASLTSTNNFINFCLTTNKPITNGQQITTGSCNPAPMGVIAATTNMPSGKFVFPKNGDTIQANQEFTVQMAINNLETGNFVNAASNYYSAPQQVNAQGDIIGHSHVVIEQLDALDQTTPTDPSKFAFFKGINGAAVNGVITADVTDGLPAGVYRMASINSAANHQPVLVAIAQHGSLDDMVYFTVSDNGASNTTASSTASDAAAASSTAAAGNTGATGKNGNANAGNNNANNGANAGGNKGAAGAKKGGRGRALRFARGAA